MECACTSKPRPKPLDLVRRGKLLGVTHGHLSRVIAGKRSSPELLEKFNELVKSESFSVPNPNQK